MILAITFFVFGLIMGFSGYCIGRFNPAPPIITSRKPIIFTPEEKANYLYLCIWNGDMNDRLYAWYRTRLHVDNYYKGRDKDEILSAIKSRIDLLRNVQKTSTKVTESGRVIEVSEYPGSNNDNL